ncbi:hypothetical protein [Streptomyces sp. NPDC094049]|uniref:hypothetical protein n=1 Tax=Streptomyces sp. NPDC094049 TaxID=3154987 RepID=UPI003322402D
MDPLDYRTDADSRLGGADITISVTADQARALGADLQAIAEWTHTALTALALLRTGIDPDGTETTPESLHPAITAIDTQLLPRLQGIKDAAVRRHASLGGSLGQLSHAMDSTKSTAQSRRKAILDGPGRPSTWEKWATDGPTQ